MADALGDILKSIEKANDIALYCHTNPDGDALGSMLALALAIKKKGKSVCAYCDMPVPEKYRSLYHSDMITFPEKGVHELAISVDCSSIDRLGQCMKSYLSAKKQIAIDHHITFERFAELCYVDGDAAACAEIIFELVKRMRALDKDIARLLFGAIVTDSGCFSFSNTTKRTHEIAAELYDYGFDAADAIYDVYKSTSLCRFKLKARVLEKALFFENDSVAVVVFAKEDFEATSTSSEHTEGIINELIDIDSVKVAYALSQVGARNFKLSVRTKSPVNAAEIAGVFGGGGHFNAAGCRVNGYLEDIIEKIVKLATDRI